MYFYLKLLQKQQPFVKDFSFLCIFAFKKYFNE